MNKSKWIYWIIVVASMVLGIAVGLTIPTETNTDYDKLVKYAQRQSVEIAIIEQTSKLENYKQQIATIQQAKQNAIVQTPQIADPKDVDVNR